MAVFNQTKERHKLNKLIENLPEDKRALCDGLIADASFMIEQLEILRVYITEHGWSEEYKNGENQYGKKTSVEADSYIKLQKSYVTTIRQLASLIPEDKEAAKNQSLLEWVDSQ